MRCLLGIITLMFAISLTYADNLDVQSYFADIEKFIARNVPKNVTFNDRVLDTAVKNANLDITQATAVYMTICTRLEQQAFSEYGASRADDFINACRMYALGRLDALYSDTDGLSVNLLKMIFDSFILGKRP